MILTYSSQNCQKKGVRGHIASSPESLTLEIRLFCLMHTLYRIMNQTRSFAWGLAPSSSRPSIGYESETCHLTDEEWSLTLSQEGTPLRNHHAFKRCTKAINPSLIPKLLAHEFMLRLAKRLIRCDQSKLTLKTPPPYTIHTAFSSHETRPEYYVINASTCFPSSGQSITRCAMVSAILDAAFVESSIVLTIRDAGIIPQDQSVTGGIMPWNASDFNSDVAS